MERKQPPNSTEENVLRGVQVGVDISNIPLDKKQSVQMKEVGGAMMPLWPMVSEKTHHPPPHPRSPSRRLSHCLRLFAGKEQSTA